MIRLEYFEPTPLLVEQLIDLFKARERPRLNKLWRYYDSDHDIKKRSMESNKPNNRLVHSYCKYVTDTISGYFMGINVQYASDNQDYLDRFSSVLADNFEDDENFELAKQASIYGYGTEILYQNEAGQSRFKRVDPREMVLVFGARLDSYLIGAIRFYSIKGLDKKTTTYADVYTESDIISYKQSEGQKAFGEIERIPHHFGQVPVIVWLNNEEMKSDFEHVIELVDAYNKSQSDSANDFEYFTDAYMVFQGYTGLDGEDSDDPQEQAMAYANMRKNRVLFLDKEGKAYFLTKEINDAAMENYKNRLNADIHKFGMVPDLGDEEFAGNLSGIAIKFKLLPLEQKTKIKENKFKTSLAKRRELLTNILNIKHGIAWDYREISEDFTRNLPQNVKEDTETILMLDGMVSKRTLLELLPQVGDVDGELERLAKEQAEDDLSQYDHFIKQESPQEVITDE